ncbi:hypothetical protein [Kurthia sp. ISK08]|uniref:hypothetical protein n=1 Tax=Kurthia sp. ISK08 TaxID=3385835 RepID=UPI0038FC0115
MNFKQLSLGKKIILITTVIALISLFLPWVELGILSASSFQQGGYLFFNCFYLSSLLCSQEYLYK